MSEFIGRGRKARRCYGFDEIALVPSGVTVNPNETDTSWQLDGQRYRVPILASAMDGVVDVKFAIAFGKMGGLAVLNLEGIQTRYEYSGEILSKIVKAKGEGATKIIQAIYREPIKEKLIAKRIRELKKAKVPASVSAIPQRAEQFGPIAQEAGADRQKPQEAKVLAIGTGKVLTNGKVVQPEVKVGDKILFGKYSGNEVKLGEDEMLILSQDDILAIIK